MLPNTLRRAVFLDRDGVINRSVVREGKPYPPANLSETEILPGVHTALNALSEAGYLLIVITNQPDVANGITTKETVEQINDYLNSSLPIDEFRVCFHADRDQCACRKPAPGALLSAAETHGINLEESYMIGDRWRDVDAGINAGCQTIFIDYGYKEQQPTAMNFSVHTLMEAAQIILGENK